MFNNEDHDLTYNIPNFCNYKSNIQMSKTK